MRIIRSDQSWHIIAPSWGERRCLVELAHRHGYRVGELCGELRCSERYLRTVFMRDVGLAPKEWLKQLRVIMACVRLERGCDVRVVGAELGFSSADNFRRAFLAHFRISPLQWSRRAESVASHERWRPVVPGRSG